MAGSPFDPNTRIEPVKGMCWWFAEVPEGGITDDTYLSGGTSEGGSYFHVKPHFHPKSDEHLMVSKGELHCEVDGKKYVVKEGDRFDIPRGIVHSVSFPAKTHTEFKVKGDHDPVAERDFLMQMMTLIQTNQFGLLKRYTCWYQSGNFVPQVGWVFPKTVGRILVLFLGGVLGTFLGLGKAHLKKD